MRKIYNVVTDVQNDPETDVYHGENRKKAFKLASETKYDSYIEVYNYEWYEYEPGVGEMQEGSERLEYWRVNGTERENLL